MTTLKHAGAGEAEGAPVAMVDVLPDSVDESTPAPVREFFDYYKTPRAQHPRSIGAYALRSVHQLAQFDADADVDRIAPRPLLMIDGTEAVTLPHSQGAVESAGESAELFTVDGATHVDLYDREEAVAPAVTKLDEFFGKHL